MKKANLERLPFLNWWWGGSGHQTWLYQLVRSGANCCGSVWNLAGFQGP
jgi:hypothetical protein